MRMRRRLLSAPLIVALLGASAAVLAWRLRVDEGRAAELRGIRAAADAAATAVSLEMELTHEGLQRLAELWGTLATEYDDASKRAGAEPWLRALPGVQVLAWVAPELADARILAAEQALPLGANDPGLRALMAGAAAEGEAPRVARDPAFGGGSYAYYVPFVADGRVRVLAALVDVTGVLQKMVDEKAGDYAVSVVWGDEVIFSRGAAAEGHPWWRAEERIPVVPGVDWLLVHRPSERLAATWNDALPWLVGGLLLSLLVAALVHQVQRGQRLITALDTANARLDDRISEAAEKDRELQRLNRELEERVAARTADLDEAVRELEAFSLSVSHDLRSPIGAILNFAAILDEDHRDSLGEGGRQIVERVIRSAESAMTLLDGLVTLSRTGRQEMHPQPLDMDALVREAFASARAARGAAEAELTVEPLPEARADRELATRVLSNLLDNALKYVPQGEKPRVHVRGWVQDGQAVYCVADQGIGFDMAFAPKLFRVFQRLHGTHEYPGSGIGLAAVDRIVRRHGGRVWAESSAGSGASFYFTLPHAEASGS
jgi:signal transduction histidine kinase